MASGHDHDHAHAHGAGASRARLAVALGIAASILALEVAGSILTGSLALLVDAGHVLVDSLGLVIALVAATLMARPASPRRTWGWLRAEVLAAGAQATILALVGVVAIVEGIRRLVEPEAVEASGLLLVACLGLAGNLASALVLAGGRGANLNMRAAFLEVVADALGSVAVIVGAIVIELTGWAQADAVASLVIAALILPRAAALLRDSGTILLESTPEGLDLDEVRRHLLGLPHVAGVHDLHASTVATGMPVLTAHVVLEEECFRDGHSLEILDSLSECVAEHHGVKIEHATFQLETRGAAAGHAGHLHG